MAVCVCVFWGEKRSDQGEINFFEREKRRKKKKKEM
jgi:hypothetical protein